MTTGYYGYGQPQFDTRPNDAQYRQTITPEIASKMLESNINNRRIDRKVVARYARDMENGNWQYNGDAIRFDKSGRLLDGQHRLLACIQSGKPFTTAVVRGLDDSAQLTIDAGKTRTMADVLGMAGENNATAFAAVLRAIYLTDHHGLEAAATYKSKPTNTELFEFYETVPQVRSVFDAAMNFKTVSHRLLTPQAYAALWWTFARRDSNAAVEFFDKLATGADLQPGNPILVLRNTLADPHNANNGTRAARRRVLALCVKAWNKWRVGSTVQLLRFGADETFPEAR